MQRTRKASASDEQTGDSTRSGKKARKQEVCPPDSPAACMHVLGQSDMKGPPGAFQQGNLMKGFICTGIRISQA